MNAHQRRSGMDVAHDEGDSGFLAAFATRFEMALKPEDAKIAPARGEVGLSDLVYNFRRSHTLIICSGRIKDAKGGVPERAGRPSQLPMQMLKS